MGAPAPAGRVTVGVDLGGTKCLGVTLDGRGRVVDTLRVPTPSGAPAVVDALATVALELSARAEPAGAAAVGVGVPGLVDRSGVLRFAPNLQGVAELDVRGALERRLGRLPVHVENDASCAGWAEGQVGAARGHGHALLATLGTGIGGGIVAEGVLYRGSHGFAGEIGHMVVDPHGPPCPCGHRGCWERFASGSGLGRMARDAAHAGRGRRMVELAGGDSDAVRGEHVTRAAAEGDPEAAEVMREFGWWVALGLANLANALDPDLFVLGGGLVEAGDVLFAPVRQAFADLVEAGSNRPEIRVVPAELGERAGAIGAALLARALVPDPAPT